MYHLLSISAWWILCVIVITSNGGKKKIQRKSINNKFNWTIHDVDNFKTFAISGSSNNKYSISIYKSYSNTPYINTPYAIIRLHSELNLKDDNDLDNEFEHLTLIWIWRDHLLSWSNFFCNLLKTDFCEYYMIEIQFLKLIPIILWIHIHYKLPFC